jgi:3-oxoadipate enol-lactonase
MSRFRLREVRTRRVIASAPVTPPWLPPGRIVTLPGRGEMFVRQSDDGDGPTLLLLHGWTASADLQWATAFPALIGEHPFVAVDHRGHGRGIRSEEEFTLEAAADDAAAAIEQLGIGPVVAVGYSMGGPISLLLALRHPHLVSGLVLCATAMEWRATRRERLTWHFLRAARPVLRPPRSRKLMRKWLEVFTEDHSPELQPLLPWLAAEMRRSDTDDLIAAGWALSRYDVRDRMDAIAELPVSVVVTTKDGLVRPAKQRALAKAANADVVELVGDHLVPWEHASAFSSAVAAAVALVTKQVVAADR